MSSKLELGHFDLPVCSTTTVTTHHTTFYKTRKQTPLVDNAQRDGPYTLEGWPSYQGELLPLSYTTNLLLYFHSLAHISQWPVVTNSHLSLCVPHSLHNCAGSITNMPAQLANIVVYFLFLGGNIYSVAGIHVCEPLDLPISLIICPCI